MFIINIKLKLHAALACIPSTSFPYLNLSVFNINVPVLIVTASRQIFSSQGLGLCNPVHVSIWAVITTEQIPTGPFS